MRRRTTHIERSLCQVIFRSVFFLFYTYHPQTHPRSYLHPVCLLFSESNKEKLPLTASEKPSLKSHRNRLCKPPTLHAQRFFPSNFQVRFNLSLKELRLNRSSTDLGKVEESRRRLYFLYTSPFLQNHLVSNELLALRFEAVPAMKSLQIHHS